VLTAILAQQTQFGTAAEAKAMLERAVAVDQAKKKDNVNACLTSGRENAIFARRRLGK
jgi:hypothetical protein